MTSAAQDSARPQSRSIAILVLAWLILQIGGLFTPGLQDDVDAIYTEIAREMLQRHDFVSPYVDNLRFFDKPPLMFWLSAASQHLFGEKDWAARLPLPFAFLALLFAIYLLGLRLFRATPNPERAAFYSSLVFATAIGPYLYTRFYIPDIVIALWMTLSVHLFLLALDRIASKNPGAPSQTVSSIEVGSSEFHPVRSALLPCLLFAATLALNLLTKGLIGIVFPLAFVVLYLALTRQLRLIPRFHLVPSTLLFLAIALPWHILAAIRNPAIPMPPGLGLPARAGWAWFYLYNEHIARFLGRRIPHDYGNTPVWLFWLYTLIWIMPWAVFLPSAIAHTWRTLKSRVPHPREARAGSQIADLPHFSTHRAALTLTLWALIVLLFFTISNRQEYYQIPALPALALLLGAALARAESGDQKALRGALDSHRWLLLPLASLIAVTCAFFALTAPHPAPGSDVSSMLSRDPAMYNLSLGHVFDLTGAAMGYFRGPLIAVTLGMIVLGPVAFALRRRGRAFAANLTLAAGMTLTLLAAHEGLVRFYPILGSEPLAKAILQEQHLHPEPNDLILLDGEFTTGASLVFYTHEQVSVVNGHINALWYGSFWPGSPDLFEDEASLRRIWSGPRRIFLLTFTPASRTTDLQPFGPVHAIASAGGKTILTNR